MCGRLPAPDLAALQTSTEVSGGRAVVVVGFVGSHSIEEAPGSRHGFLSATWLSVVCSAEPRLPRLSPNLQAQASAKTTKVPLLLAALFAPLPSLKPGPPPPSALPLLDADTASTAGVL